jgi:hypothetical protein
MAWWAWLVTGFAAGCFVGGSVGLLACGLAQAAGRSSRAEEHWREGGKL